MRLGEPMAINVRPFDLQSINYLDEPAPVIPVIRDDLCQRYDNVECVFSVSEHIVVIVIRSMMK